MEEGTKGRTHVVAYQNLDPDWDHGFKKAWFEYTTEYLAHRVLTLVYGKYYEIATEVANFPYWEDRDVGGGVFAAANECMQYIVRGGRGNKLGFGSIPFKLRIKLGELTYNYLRSIGKKVFPWE